jgi:hypothetical protein
MCLNMSREVFRPILKKLHPLKDLADTKEEMVYESIS